MTTLNAETVDFICVTLARLMEKAPSVTMTAETDMTQDLNVDSLTAMDLVFELEENYDISIPLNDLGDIYKIGQLAELVERLRSAS